MYNKTRFCKCYKLSHLHINYLLSPPPPPKKKHQIYIHCIYMINTNMNKTLKSFRLFYQVDYYNTY